MQDVARKLKQKRRLTATRKACDKSSPSWKFMAYSRLDSWPTHLHVDVRQTWQTECSPETMRPLDLARPAIFAARFTLTPSPPCNAHFHTETAHLRAEIIA